MSRHASTERPRTAPKRSRLENADALLSQLLIKRMSALERALLQHMRECLGGRVPDCSMCQDTGNAICDAGVGWYNCPECAEAKRR
jgi:hypothetical protein